MVSCDVNLHALPSNRLTARFMCTPCPPNSQFSLFSVKIQFVFFPPALQKHFVNQRINICLHMDVLCVHGQPTSVQKYNKPVGLLRKCSPQKKKMLYAHVSWEKNNFVGSAFVE